MKIDNQTYCLSEKGNFGKRAFITGIIGIVLSFIGYMVDSEYFFHSYLTSYVFWFTISLGALFFTMLHHLVNATWSVVLRRISESVMIVLPFMIIFFIPPPLTNSEFRYFYIKAALWYLSIRQVLIVNNGSCSNYSISHFP